MDLRCAVLAVVRRTSWITLPLARRLVCRVVGLALVAALLSSGADAARVLSLKHYFDPDQQGARQVEGREQTKLQLEVHVAADVGREQALLPIEVLAWQAPLGDQAAETLPVGAKPDHLANEQGQYYRLINLRDAQQAKPLDRNSFVIEVVLDNLQLEPNRSYALFFEARAQDSLGNYSSVVSDKHTYAVAAPSRPAGVELQTRTVVRFLQEEKTKTITVETPKGPQQKVVPYTVEAPVYEQRAREVQVFAGGRYKTKSEFRTVAAPPMSQDPNIKAEQDRIRKSQLVDRKRVQAVYYATNRRLKGSQVKNTKSFGNKIAPTVRYGVAGVRIPPTHSYGAKIKAPTWYDWDDPTEHFRVERLNPLGDQKFFETMRACLARDAADDHATRNDVLLYVHGYNTSMEFALLRLGQVAFDTGFEGRPCAFVWPSDAMVSRYKDDREDARKSVDQLAALLVRMTRAGNPGRVHVLAHSMGNYLFLQAAQKAYNRWKQLPEEQRPRFGHVILAAPDVGVDKFNLWAPNLPDITDSVTHYHCRSDIPLKASSLFHSVVRAGLHAVNILGLDNVDCDKANTTFLGHSAFADAHPVLFDIQMLLQRDVKPSLRYSLEEVAEPIPSYFNWRIRPGIGVVPKPRAVGPLP